MLLLLVIAILILLVAILVLAVVLLALGAPIILVIAGVVGLIWLDYEMLTRIFGKKKEDDK